MRSDLFTAAGILLPEQRKPGRGKPRRRGKPPARPRPRRADEAGPLG